MRQRDYELVFSSGGAWAAHLAAAWIKRRTGVRWIAEVHDPMVIRDDARDDGTAPRRNRNARYVQKLEGVICREADRIWWFTEAAHDYALLRHPELGDKGFVVYPGSEAPEVEGTYVESGLLNICHFGSLTNDRSMSRVINGLAEAASVMPEILDSIRFHTYGTVVDEAGREAMRETGLDRVVVEHGRLEFDPKTGLSGRARVTRAMFEADVLLLLHGDYEWCAEYIPSKYYEYLWAKRPILAVTNRSDSFDRLLTERSAYICHTLDNQSIAKTLIDVYQDWRNHRLRLPRGEPISVASAVDRILEGIN